MAKDSINIGNYLNFADIESCGLIAVQPSKCTGFAKRSPVILVVMIKHIKMTS